MGEGTHGRNTPHFIQRAVGERLFPVFVEDNSLWGAGISPCFSWVPDPSCAF